MADNKKHSKHPLVHRILVVDDERDFVEILTDILKSRGYIIESANSVDEARKKIEDFDADVALLDIRLGLESGINLLSWIKEKRPSTICVMMTAYAAITTAIEAIQAGAYDYLRKPIETQDLLITLDRCFEKIRIENERDVAESTLKEKNRELVDINERLRTIVKSTHSLTAASGIGEMGRILLDEFADNMAVEGGSLYFVEDGSLILAHTLDPGHAPKKIPLPLKKNTILERVMRTGEVILIKDIEQSGKLQKSGWKGYSDGSLLVFPLPDPKGNIKGIITLHNKSQSAFTEQDCEIGLILASYSYEALLAAAAMEEVNEGRKNLQTLFDTMEDFLFIYDFEGKIVHVNPAVERGLGYTVEELFGTDFHRLLAVNDDEDVDVTNIVERIIKGDVKGNVEGDAEVHSFLLKKSDGALISVESTDAKGQWGGRDVIFLISRAITERLLAEEALRESELKYRELIENAIDVIYTIDLNGRLIDLNEAFVKESGYSKEELIGRSIQIIVHPDDLSMAKKYFKKGLRGESFQDEIRTIDKDKNVKWFSFISRPVTNKNGSMANINVISRNITARVMAEEALIASERNYREIFNASNEAVFVHDSETGEILDVNQTTCNMLGYTHEEALKLTVGDFSQGEAPYAIGDAIRWIRKAKEEGPQLFEWYTKRKNGELFWAETNLKHSIIGGKNCVLAVVRDITDRKQAEEALRQSEQKSSELIENALDIIYTLDLEGNLTDLNEAILQESGYSREELIGNNLQKFIHPDNLFIANEHFKKSLRGESCQDEIRTISKNGDVKWFSSISRPVISKDGSVTAINVFARNITDRVMIEEKLRESEDKYRTVVENAKEAILVLQDGIIKFFNPRAIEISGYTEEELISIPFDTLIHPKDMEKVFERYVREIDGEDFLSPNLYRILRKDGNIRWIEGIGISIIWYGKPASLTFISDVTEKMTAETALIESEIRYLTLMENLPIGVYRNLPGEKGKFIMANPAFLEMFEIGSEKELKELRAADLYSNPKDYILFSKNLLEKGSVTGYEQRLKKHDGTSIWGSVTAKVVYDDYGKPLHFDCAMEDISERKAAEEAFRKSEEMYRDLFQSSRDTIYLSNIEGKFDNINLAGEQLFGHTRNELLKLKISSIYNDSNERDNFQKAIEQQGFVIDYEIVFKKKDGTLIDTLVTASLKKNEAGNITGYQGIIKDVTDKKRLEAQLVQTQKMEAVGTLAGGMAHNFNNILVGIMGYSEFLLRKKGNDDPDYKALRTIHDGTLRASDLTKQLLNIARGQEFRFTKLKLNDVVEKVLPLISGTFEKSIEIETHLEDDLLTINGDRGQLEQCLLNLCINAKDAMPQGGRLIIETKNQEMDDEFVRTHIDTQQGDYVALFVTDTGIGMTMEARKRIFEPFYSTKEDKGGTGLGLSTVYGIIKKHSGIITIYSEVGEGSTFKLYFPAVTGTAKATNSEIDIGKITGDETLLIIDDEPIVVDMWRDFLEDMGYKVMTAADGEEGIALFKESTDEIDLVILDYVLPGMSGMETFKKLKEIEPNVKVLVSSGYSENGQANNISKDGRDGFIQKPARLNELSAKIRGILDK